MRSFSLHACALALALSACSAASGSDGGATIDDSDTIVADETGTIDDDAISPIDDAPSTEDANDGGATDDAHDAGESTDAGSDTGHAPSDTGVVADTGPTSGAGALIVEPTDGVTPITDAIKAAKSSVRMEMYLLSDTEILNALVAAKKAGHTVQVILEASPYESATANQAAYSTLSSAGVDVHWTTGLYQLTHTKTFLVDDAHAYVMSLNATYTAVTSDRDYAVRDEDASDVAEVKAIIAADIAGTKINPAGNLVVSPTNSRTKLTALIDDAKTTLDLEMEELDDSSIVQHLEGALARGVKMRIVVPSSGRPAAMDPALKTLEGKGATVKTLSTPDPHAKVIVADSSLAYLGSVNLTAASLDYNREIGVIVSTAAVVSKIETTIAGDVAKGATF